MCGSKTPTVPDVSFQKKRCPRCVVPKKTLSQMCCSKNANVPDVSLNDFQKGNCPRCVVQKHPLSQMCRSKKRMPAFTERKTKKDEHHSPQQLALVQLPGTLSGHLLLVKETQKYESSPLPSLALALFESIRARLRVTRRKEAASEECVVQLRLSFRKNILKKKRFPPFFKDTLSLVLFASLVGDGGMVGGLSPPRLSW